MPRSGMEAPANAEYCTFAEWHRSPVQSVTLLTDSTSPSLRPDRPKPAISGTVACVRCQSAPPQASALAGREAAYGRVLRTSSDTPHSSEEI